MENKLDKFFDAVTTKMTTQDENQRRMEAKFDQIAKNHSSFIHNIEVQLGQLAITLTSRSQSNLPSNTEINPREQLKSITLKSGKEINTQLDASSVEKDQEDTKGQDLIEMEVKIF